KVDPIQYRLRHLVDPRLIAAVNAVAQKAKWDTRPSPKGGSSIYNAFHGISSVGRGFSCYLHQNANGYAAMAAEVTVNESTGEITVTKVTTSIDSGPVIHPDGLTNQMEGQVIQGISRTLYEEVLFDRASSSITTRDWRSYWVLKFGDTIPEIVTILI